MVKIQSGKISKRMNLIIDKPNNAFTAHKFAYIVSKVIYLTAVLPSTIVEVMSTITIKCFLLKWFNIII